MAGQRGGVHLAVQLAGHRLLLAGHLTRRIRDRSDAMLRLHLIDRSAASVGRASQSDLLSVVHYVLIIQLLLLLVKLLLVELLLVELLIELLLVKGDIRRTVSIVFIIHLGSHRALRRFPFG